MSNRRNFIKLAGLGGLGFELSGCGAGGKGTTVYALDEIHQAALKPHTRIFNMCGYAAPKMETVRIAYIGTGNRGTGAIKRIPHIASVDVKAVCDVQKKAENTKRVLEGVFSPDIYVGDEDWKKVCERDDIDPVYICTPWEMHVPMALYAMEHGKHVAVEMPVAQTVDDCWELAHRNSTSSRH